MALEEVMRAAMDAGIQRFELINLGGEGDPDVWHWDVFSDDPVRWFDVSLPTDFSVEWLGWGAHPEKPLGFLPVGVRRCASLRVGVHRGCERAGCQGVVTTSLELGLRHALRAYVCEFDAATCKHAACPSRDACDMERDSWL